MSKGYILRETKHIEARYIDYMPALFTALDKDGIHVIDRYEALLRYLQLTGLKNIPNWTLFRGGAWNKVAAVFLSQTKLILNQLIKRYYLRTGRVLRQDPSTVRGINTGFEKLTIHHDDENKANQGIELHAREALAISTFLWEWEQLSWDVHDKITSVEDIVKRAKGMPWDTATQTAFHWMLHAIAWASYIDNLHTVLTKLDDVKAMAEARIKSVVTSTKEAHVALKETYAEELEDINKQKERLTAEIAELTELRDAKKAIFEELEAIKQKEEGVRGWLEEPEPPEGYKKPGRLRRLLGWFF